MIDSKELSLTWEVDRWSRLLTSFITLDETLCDFLESQRDRKTIT